MEPNSKLTFGGFLVQSCQMSTAIFNFFKTASLSKDDNLYVCNSRDQASGRLTRWSKDFHNFGLPLNEAILLGSIVGEISNNCFDHNLGQWNDFSGCLVGFEYQAKSITIYIVDRGQGIISSLSKATEVTNKKLILSKAFEERISGRAPEKRGNGLKFVIQHIASHDAGLACYSQGETYFKGTTKLNIDEFKLLPTEFGTLILIEWRIK